MFVEKHNLDNDTFVFVKEDYYTVTLKNKRLGTNLRIYKNDPSLKCPTIKDVKKIIKEKEESFI